MVVVRVTTWSQQCSVVSITAPAELFIPVELPSQGSTVLAAAFEAYAPKELHAPVVQQIARARRSPSTPGVEFLRVNKEVLILEEAFAPVEDSSVEGEWKQIQGAVALPTNDEIKVAAVESAMIETTQLVALMDQLKMPTDTVVAKTEVAPSADEPVSPVTDSVQTAQAAPASAVDAEPEFFEIPAKKTEMKAEGVATTERAAEPAPIEPPDYNRPEGWDLPVSSQATAAIDEVKLDDDIETFSYGAPVSNSVPVVEPVSVTTQSPAPAPAPVRKPGYSVPTQGVRVAIAPVAVGLNKVSALKRFEVQSKGDDGDYWENNDDGQVVWNEAVVGESTRSVIVQDRAGDYMPTHVEVAMVKKIHEIPVFSVEKMRTLPQVTANVPTGYILVELDEETVDVDVDGSPVVKTKLTQDFVVTKKEDHRYILLSGVEVGNRSLAVKQSDGRSAFRVVHVEQNEMTFETNLYAAEERLDIKLNEEDLLAKRKRPLVISGDQVTAFFTNKKAQKSAPDTYNLPSVPRLLGSRQYLALSHQGENILVGVEGSGSVEVPSEGLMREVIRRFKLTGSAQACIIQVNLDRAVKGHQVLAQSYDKGHVSYSLALDADGEFYESPGEASRRLFIMSENRGGSFSENAKINIRLEYLDGSIRSFSSYCSPNTYLVEQL